MDKAICRGCNAPMLWAVEKKDNKPVPLNVNRTTIYVVNDDGTVSTVTGYIPHHATCPKVAQFRKSKS